MRAFFLAAVLLSSLALPALAEKQSVKDARSREQARSALQQYLEARYRGDDWKHFGPLVMWSAEQEQHDSACATVVRSYDIGEVRLQENDRAIAAVTFYQLGTYCPADRIFERAPQLETALFQLRHRSVVWLVEKTNRPGGHIGWQAVRDQLKKALADPTLSVADTAKCSLALATLERTANAIGKTSDKR